MTELKKKLLYKHQVQSHLWAYKRYRHSYVPRRYHSLIAVEDWSRESNDNEKKSDDRSYNFDVDEEGEDKDVDYYDDDDDDTRLPF